MIKDANVVDLLDPVLFKHVNESLGFKKFTAVQETAIKHFLNKFDCIVQAPTGSGKTLAYLLPMLQILNSKRSKADDDRCEVLAIILAPSRELVTQISNVLRPMAEKFDYNVIKLIGGGGTKVTKEKAFQKQCIVVGTPVRLEHTITKFPHLKPSFRALEMLIVDEADRFADQEFKTSVSTILSCIPKQRHTGLFSATQAKEVEELLKFGLRNPVRINVASDGAIKVGESMDDIKQETQTEVAPKELENYYTCVPADQKLLALINFLNENPNSKVLVFVCSSAAVDYFNDILPHLIQKTKRQFLAVHRRKYSKRQKIIDTFRKSKKAVLLCTDLMARGLDITDIDWVFQYDIPKQSSWFVHRSGRTARSGRVGKAVVLLTQEEEAYVEFMQNYEHIQLFKHKINGLNETAAVELREKVRKIAVTDRRILLNGTRAFVSFIEAYVKHDCQIVCKLKDQDIAGIAHSFGLLRLPLMRELRGRTDLKNFEKAEITTSNIAFKDPKKEAVRLEKQKEKREAQSVEKEKQVAKEKQRTENPSKRQIKRKFAEAKDVGNLDDPMQKPKKLKKTRKEVEWQELQSDERLLKGYKKGKISKSELNERL
ncbi:putative ATP-dependent RNA helicase DDX55-like protein [Aphelenchoides besseyi]|nr:putative ATP-dependent RNA helicase DDX55-like protein [Aphelenchoides besseyi]